MGRRRTILLLVIALVLSACDWTQYGFDAGHGSFNPLESAIGANNVATLKLRWSAPSAWLPEVVGNRVVAVGLQGTVSRLETLDAKTGGVVWQGPPVSPPVIPVANATSVFTANPAGVVEARDLATGALRWSVHSLCVNALPAESGGRVYLNESGTGASRICVLDANDGHALWSTGTSELRSFLPAVGEGVLVAVAGPLSGDKTVTAHDAATGALKWSQTLVGITGNVGPVIANGRVFIGEIPVDSGRASPLTALDAETGRVLWTAPPAGFLAAGGTTVISVKDGVGIRALDANSGAERWSILGPTGIVFGKPAIANGIVYVPSQIVTQDGRITNICCVRVAALDLMTGGELASFPSEELGVLQAPEVTIANGALYLRGARPGTVEKLSP